MSRKKGTDSYKRSLKETEDREPVLILLDRSFND